MSKSIHVMFHVRQKFCHQNSFGIGPVAPFDRSKKLACLNIDSQFFRQMLLCSANVASCVPMQYTILKIVKNEDFQQKFLDIFLLFFLR